MRNQLLRFQPALARAQRVWRSPARTRATLLAFAETEEDGAKDLDAATRRIADPFLRGHVERHAADERRHASILRRRAAELALDVGEGGGAGADSRRDLEGSARRGAVASHGFYSAGLYDELGEVAYVAMLHVAERRAAKLFELHHRAAEADPETAAVFAEIVTDEKYHVAYTQKILERWRAAGRGHEVDEALSRARSSRFVGAWKRLGLRSAGGLGRVLLYVAYFTVLAPFGLVARRQRFGGGWRDPKPHTPASQS